MNQAAEKVSREFQQVYKREFGMLRTEWRVLFHLGQYGAMTARDICDRGNLHKTKVSRAVAALETKRFLKRRTVAADRRHEILELTTAGHEAFGILAEHARAYQRKLMQKLTDTEFENLTTALGKLSSDRPS